MCKHRIALILIIPLFFSSCISRSSTSVRDNTPYGSQITENEAIEIVKREVGEDEKSQNFEVDTYTVYGVSFFRVHVYTLGPIQTFSDNGKEYRQTYTLGWFYVHPETGVIYVDGRDSLIPYEPPTSS